MKVERAILEVHKRDEKSLYSVVKKSPFWGIMHDQITKFQKELNGIAVRGIHTRKDANAPITTPISLKQMKGGVNAYDVGKSFLYSFGILFLELSIINFLA